MILFGADKLASAISKGDIQRVNALLKRGIDPDVQGEFTDAPLERALKAGHLDIASLLVDAGSKQLRLKYGQGTILYLALAKGYTAFAAEFIKKRPESLITSCSDGDTPLHAAAVLGDVTIARFLLEHGADPNKKDHDKRTPLYRAQKNGRDDIVALLQPQNAAPSDQDEWKKTGEEEIAHITFREQTGLHITDIFNFAVSERRTVCLDRNHGVQSNETKPFEHCSSLALEQAFDALRQQGGLKDHPGGFFRSFKG